MLWLLGLLMIWTVYYRWTRRRIYQLSKEIKCNVATLPIIGHAYMCIGGSLDCMKAIKRLGREAIIQNGLTNLWIGPKYFVVMADPEMLELVLKSCLEKDDIMHFVRLGTGNGSIFAPVSIWRPRRKIVAPIFSPKNLNLFVDIFFKQSCIMVSQLQNVPKGTFSIWRYLTSYTMDSVCGTTLGLRSYGQNKQEKYVFKPFETCSKLIAQRIVRPWLHPLSLYKMTPQYAMFMKLKTAGYEILGQIVKSKREECNENRNASNKQEEKIKTFIELIIEKDEEKQFTDLELQEEALVLILAGTDTSAIGSSYTALTLSRHQDVQEKVYKEIMDVLGDTDRPIVAGDLPNFKYLEAVIRETLRLHPPAPVIVRKIDKDITLSSGITLVKGCSVMVNIWAVHRNPKYWGLDADEFRPERFFEDYDKRAFMAFSSGPRSCLGYQYAMMSMKTVLASLIRQYRVLPAEEDIVHDGPNITYKPIEDTFKLVMKDANRFKVQLESRN